MTLVKDKDALLDYSVDWSGWLPEGDAITTSTWTPEDGITVETDPAPTIAGGVTTCWVSGGVVGERYDLTNGIVTAQGRRDDRTIRLHVQER